MRSRGFHEPTVHAPTHGETKAVSWLELFYDLIFVAAIIQLGDFLSHKVSMENRLLFAGHFVPL
jgi:low temperature requirement protein LtrA